MERYRQGGLFRLVQALVAGLLVARLLVPPESSVFGDTLWIVQLWIAATSLWAWDAYRRRDFRLRLGWVDLWLWLVVVGHGVATAFVFADGGDRRAAVNLLWEWAGLGVSFFLLRQTLRTSAEAGRLLTVMMGLATGMAGLGLWQHYVAQPRMVKNYTALRAELDSPATAPMRRQQIVGELQRMGVPLSGPTRFLFENRMRAKEPFGTFALANSYAGFLAVWFLVGVAVVVHHPPNSPWRKLAAWVSLLAIAFVILLTKSRTAWLALVVGGCVWAALAWVRNAEFSRKLRLAVSGTMAVCAAMIAVAGLSGGFDREVITEATKSLAYRAQYWEGAIGVVKESPVWGVGPGNFRDHYFKHKVPESSEEIADPHNFLLDLWTSGGLIAVLAFLAFFIAAAQSALRRGTSDGSTSDSDPESSPRSLTLGMIAGFAAVCAGQYWMTGQLETAVCIAVLCGLFACSWWSSAFAEAPQGRLLIPAAVVFLVHLSGAGGIEMAGIMQIFLVIVAAATWRPLPECDRPDGPKLCVLSFGLMTIPAFGLCLTTATLPVINSHNALSAGGAELQRSRFSNAADKLYEQATYADPLSTLPLYHLGDLYANRWESAALDGEKYFEKAVGFYELIAERNPYSPLPHRKLGNLFKIRGDQLREAADYRTAAGHFTNAVARYPNSAGLRADNALTLLKSGDQAAAVQQADIALRLDDLNRAAGHSDKVLATETRAELELIE